MAIFGGANGDDENIENGAHSKNEDGAECEIV